MQIFFLFLLEQLSLYQGSDCHKLGNDGEKTYKGVMEIISKDSISQSYVQ